MLTASAQRTAVLSGRQAARFGLTLPGVRPARASVVRRFRWVLLLLPLSVRVQSAPCQVGPL